MRRPRRAWPLCLLTVLLMAACASTPRVSTVMSTNTDFSKFATFGFLDTLGTDREHGTRTILSERLMQATRLQLEAHGYRYTDQDPDLRVNFFVDTRQVVESRPASVDVRYGIYHRPYRVWAGYGTDLHQFTEGWLHVDVVDVARNQMVWEGVARQRLADDDFTFEPEQVNEAVRLVFARFPRAG